LRKQREQDRAEALETARRLQQREEEAEQRAKARAAERKAPVAAIPAATETWRRSSATLPPPSHPGTPPRAESPAPTKYLRGGQPPQVTGWRAREMAKAARPASPVPPPPTTQEAKVEPKGDEDGFQPAKAWRSKRLQGK